MRGLFLLFALCASSNGLKIQQNDKEETQEGRPVFYAVIMGGLAFRHQVSLWYGSLRKVGGWEHEAVMITDKPDCLQKTLQEAKLLGEKIYSSEAVDIFGPAPGYKGNLHMVKRPVQKNVKMMKLEKARAFLNLKVANLPQPASSVIYTDEDVIISAPVTEFVTHVRELEKGKNTLALFQDMGAARGEPHTGVVIMFPTDHTADCLQAWGKKLTSVDIAAPKEAPKVALKDKNSEHEMEMETEKQEISEHEQAELDAWYQMKGVDQQALAGTKQCKPDAEAGHEGIKFLDRKFFMLAPLVGLLKFHPRVFIHFTNTMRWDQVNSGTLRKYLDRIGAPANLDPKGTVKDRQCAASLSLSEEGEGDETETAN